jgi:hypothetical protein
VGEACRRGHETNEAQKMRAEQDRTVWRKGDFGKSLTSASAEYGRNTDLDVDDEE